MSFTNVMMDSAALPRAETLDWTPMPPEYRSEVKVQAILMVGFLTIVAVVLGLVIPFPAKVGFIRVLLPSLVLLIGIVATLFALMKIRHKGYALREHDVAYRSGLFWRKVVVLPFNRIQHAEVSSGPLQRRYGLATLKFFTAGGSSVDLKIVGLPEAEAERLRAHILRRSAHALETD
jgi:membrane protein YdbS with pleckstrin-like domain